MCGLSHQDYLNEGHGRLQWKFRFLFQKIPVVDWVILYPTYIPNHIPHTPLMETGKGSLQERLMEWAGLPSKETEGFLGKTFLLRSMLPPCPASGARSDWGWGEWKKANTQTCRRAGIRCAVLSDRENGASQKLSLLIMYSWAEKQGYCIQLNKKVAYCIRTHKEAELLYTSEQGGRFSWPW